MGVELRIALVTLLASTAVVNISVLAQLSVPDVFSAPEYEVIVYYPGEDRIHLDNELTLTQVKDIPTVDYDASPEVFYTPEFVADSEMSDVARAFIDHEVVPDVILVAPKFDAEIKFPSGVQANLGNEVTPTQVKDMPTTLWKTSPNTFYTLIMTGPDAPSRAKPRIREWQHWLVGNIPGNNVDAGETLTEFVSSGPYLGTGIHRHVFLVYEQPGRIQYDVPRLNNTSAANRSYFSTVDFARRYNLGEPIAGNFYQAQYDDIVPSSFARLGLDPASIL